MSKAKRKTATINPGLDPDNCDVLVSLMADYAERRPELEAPMLNIAKRVGLTEVVNRITRLRRYAKSHRVAAAGKGKK